MNSILVHRRARAALVLLVLAWPAPGSAATLYVTTFAAGSASDGQCSLREAITAVNQQAPSFDCPAGNGDNDFIILLNPGTYQVSSTLNVSRDVRIEGTGKEGTTISFNGAFSGFVASSATWFTLAQATLDGNALATRCVHSNGATVEVLGVRITGCTQAGAYASAGGGLSIGSWSEIVSNTGHGIHLNNAAGLGMSNSVVAYNDALGGNGGGLYQVGGGANTNIYNTTFAHNSAARGGGIYFGPSNYLHVYKSTIAYNSATIQGGGAYQGGTGSPHLFQSIVAGNTANPSDADSGHDTFGDLPTTWTLHGNLRGNTSSYHENSIYATPPQTLDARLGPLTSFTGVTLGVPLRAGSYAIDRYENDPGEDFDFEDQRGGPRPVMIFPWNGTWTQDLGSIEMGPLEIEGLFQAETLPVVNSSGDSHTLSSSSELSGEQGTHFQSNAVNDYVTYRVTVPQSGTYEVRSAHRFYNNRGMVRLFHSTSASSGFSAIGGSIDLYSANVEYAERIHGTLFLPAGTRYLRFYVTSKNVASSGYRMLLDFITLIRM